MKRILLNLLGALAVGAAFNLQLSTGVAQSTGYTLLTTFTNPMQAFQDCFGYSVAAVGRDRVLIGARHDDTGATWAGAAYLFSTNGALLMTFTNPTPAANDFFGSSLAVMGSDRVLIGAESDGTGAPRAGAAYLFSTNGALLMTFTNPTPAASDFFGFCVAVVGTDRVVIGALRDGTGAPQAGAAYLFNTNATLLTTFTNPSPADGDYFGSSVTALDADRVLIGASGDDTGATNAGTAYLFSSNGALLTTFTKPTPTAGDYFGRSVAALGTDRVLIGAYNDDTGAPRAGAAYLFSSNGVWLSTFTNPTPAQDDFFGWSAAAVGTDRVLIGAYNDDAGARDAGAAYMFSTNGTLLNTFTNPTPARYAWLGYSVAAVGSDWVLIGAPYDGTTTLQAGAAYLFSTAGVPILTIQLTITNTVAVSWLSPSTDWTLQQNTNGVASVNWSNAPGPIQDDGTNKTLIVDSPTKDRFYRLFKP